MKSSRNLFGRRDSRPPSGRWPFCAVVVASGLLMIAPAAHAGHWEMSWRPDGVSSSQNYGGDTKWVNFFNWGDGYNPTTGRVEGKQEVYWPGNFGDSNNVQGGSQPFWRALSVTQKGSVTVYLKWVQDLVYGPGGPTQGPFIPADKVVVLRFTGYVYAQAVSPTSQSEVTASFGDIQGTETIINTGNSYERVSDTGQGYRPWMNLREVSIPLAVPQGSTEVQYTFPLETKATTQQMPAPDPSNPPSVSGQFLLQAQVVTVGVAITSDIETSWKKFTGAASDLPDAYKKRDSSGNLINEPNDKAVLVTPNATDPGKNIWKIACLRSADGKMTVESAADYLGDKSGGTLSNQKWWGAFAWAKMRANTQGYSIPEWEWSYSGGTATGRASLGFASKGTDKQEIGIGHFSPGTDANNYYTTGFDLGSTLSAPSVKSTTFTVKVDDTDPSRPTNLLSDSYTVKWHAPLENAAMTTVLKKDTNYDQSASDWVPMNTPIDVTVQPGNVTWSLLGGGTALLSAAGVVFFEGEAAPIFDLVMTAANYGITTLAPSPIVKHDNLSYDYYADAIRRQQEIQTGQADPTNFPRVAGLSPSELSDAAASVTNAGNVTSDPFYSQKSGSIRGKIVVARPWENDQWQGDLYDHNGFTNATTYNLKGDRAPIYVSQLSFNGITQMMTPPGS